MSPAARTSHYLRKLISKEITREQYDTILKVVLGVPYIPIVSQDGEMVVDSRQATEAVEQTPTGVLDTSSAGRGEAEPTHGENTQCTPAEWCAELSLPLDTPRAIQRSDKTVEDNSKSQKSRLLKLLQDKEWHSTPEIQEVVYGGSHLGCSRIAARADDLRRDGYTIQSQKVSRSIWKYRLAEQDERITQIADNFMAG